MEMVIRYYVVRGPDGANSKACLPAYGRRKTWSWIWVGKIPGEKDMAPTPIVCLEISWTKALAELSSISAKSNMTETPF